MKKVLGILAVGLMATAANAATIGLRWAETPTQNLEAMSGHIEVYVNLIAGESLSTVVFNYAAGTNLNLVANGTNVPGWAAAGAPGALNGSQFASAANPGFNVQGPANIVAGYTTIAVTGLPDLTVKQIFGQIPQNAVGVLKGDGAAFTWDARYSAETAGYISFGNWGNPGWGTKTTKGHQPTPNPLLITKTPEPTSLALVALGGFALLRRRR